VLLRGHGACLRCVKGEAIPAIAERLRLASRVATSGFDDAKRAELFVQILSSSPGIHQSFPLEWREVTADEFASALASDDSRVFVDVVSQFQVIPRDTLVQYLQQAAPKISGTAYPVLHLVYSVITGGRGSMESDVLALLYQVADHAIDFHMLMADPTTTIQNSISLENGFGLLPLIGILGLDLDKALLHLVCDKMESSSLDEYLPFVSRLKSEASLLPLLRRVMPRFSVSDQVGFLDAIGRLDAMGMR